MFSQTVAPVPPLVRQNYSLLFVCKIVTTRASPTRYTTGHLQGRTQI